MELDLHAFTLEERADQLLEAARDDVDVPTVGLRRANELRETGADLRLFEGPCDDLVERSRDRLELARDHFAKRKPASVEAVLDLLVHGGIAELERRPVEKVGHGDRPVEVQNHAASVLHFRLVPVTHAFELPQYDCNGEEVGCA